MIAIIDYDAGNLTQRGEGSAIFLGEECVDDTRSGGRSLEADKVILPGVGAFGDAMEKLTPVRTGGICDP